MSILNDIDRMDQLIAQTNNETTSQSRLSNDDIDAIFSSLDNKKQAIKSTQSSDSSDFIPGVQRGIQNLQASSYGTLGLAGAGLKGLGFEESGQKLQDIGFAGYHRNIEEAKQYPAKYSFKDVYTGKAGLGGTVDYAQGVLGELVPSMAEAAVGAAVGSMAAPGPGTAVGGFAGRTVLKKSIDQTVKGLVKEGTEKAVEDQIRKQVTKQALKKLGGKIGIGAAVFPMESGIMYGDLFESHGVDAPETAMLFGALSTALEYAGGNSKLVDTFVDAMAKGSKGTAKKTAKEILLNIPQEALQEGGQEVASILNTVVNTDEKLLTLDNLERVIESAAAGAIGGGAGAGVHFATEGKNFVKPSDLDIKVDNIKSGGLENIQAALTDLDAKDNFANSLLNNPAELQTQADQFDISVEELRNNIGSQIMTNNQLRERLKVELAKPTEEVKPQTEPVDVNAKLEEVRKQQEAKQQQINSLNTQADKLRKEFYKSTDETVKEDLRKQIFEILTQRNALINEGKQETAKPGTFEEPKKADEILADRQKFWQDNWVDESNVERRPEMADKSAQQSADVINNNKNQIDARIAQEELDRAALTNEQRKTIIENNIQIKQLTDQYNTSIDRTERISLLNQIDELNKINSGIRLGIENTAQLGDQNDFDLTNTERPNITNEDLGEVDYSYLSDTDLAKAINDAEIERVINQANQSMAELRQKPSTVGSQVEQTVEHPVINPNNIDVSRYINFDENAGTPAYVITKNKTPYKNRRVLEKIIKSFPNYQNYMIVETTNGFVGVRKDISETEAKQFQTKQRTKSQNINQATTNATDITPTDITPTDLNQSNIIPQFRVSEQQFKAVDPNSNQFKNWFAGSVITDENNAPLKVYHGSKTFGIDQDTQWIFNNDQGIQGTQSPMAGLGFFFATDRNEAQGYAGSGNGTIHSVYLNIKNPLVVNSYEIPQFNSREEAQAFAKRMELAGFDGIHIQDEGHYIAFKPEQIKSADLNTGGFSSSNPDIRFQTNENNQLTKQVSIEDIKSAFPNQQINQAEDGSISIQFKNGKGLTIKNIQAAENNFVKYAIETGQMSKNGKILGMTIGNEILLDENFADNATLWHENKHVLDNLGIITDADNSMLNAEFNRLRKAGKLSFALSTHEDSVQRMVENRANMFAQIMIDRAAYRDKPLGKVIQRVMDFFQQLFSFGKQTVAGLAREVESGKIYERQVGNQTYQTTVPHNEVTTKQWYSALENAVASMNAKQAPSDQWKGMINNYPGLKAEELEWIGLNDWLDEKQGKVSKAELMNFIQENNVQLEEVMQGTVDEDNLYAALGKIEKALEPYEYYAKIYDGKLVFTSPEGFEVNENNIDDAFISQEIKNIFHQSKNILPEILNDPRYSNMTLPGGKNYKELILTLPEKQTSLEQDAQTIYGKSFEDLTTDELRMLNSKRDSLKQSKSYQHSHWYDINNPLAHIRFDERTDADGNKILFINELQSDWHQEGRRSGYGTREEIKNNLIQQLRNGEISQEEYNQRRGNLMGFEGVPDAPFKKSWPLLTMKRMIRYAAENGFDKIAWPSTPDQVAQVEGWGDIEKRGDAYFIHGDTNVSSIVNRYLQDMPRMLNKEFNRGKWGSARVEQINIGLYDKIKISQEEALKRFENGETIFIGNNIAKLKYAINNYRWDDIYVATPNTLSFPITDRMRSKALSEGMPLFQTKPQHEVINQTAFKKWFNNSKVIDSNGVPLIVYHTTMAKPFDIFKTEYISTNFKTKKEDKFTKGAWFTDDKNYAKTYKRGGNIKSFYLSLQNPLDMRELGEEATKAEIDAFYQSKGLPLKANHDWDDDPSPIFDEPKMRMDKLKSYGYDGVILKEDNNATSYIVFNPTQIKSVDNNTWDSNNPNVYFETREMPEQKLTDEEYAKRFQQKKSIWKLYQQASKINWQSTKLLADKLFTPISTRLKEANLKFVSDELRKLDFRTSKNIIDVLQTAKPILDIANGIKNAPNKMTPQDRSMWNDARLQADTAVIKRLADKYGITKQVEKLRAKLDQIRADAIDVGLDVGFIDEYWPRILKDPAGFLQKFYEDKEFSQRPIFTEALNQKAKDMGITRDELESYPDVKADVISNVILGRPTGLGGPGNIRSRKFDTIPPDYIEFYMDADAALMQYVYSMTKKIEARRFFGAVPENIRKAKTAKTSKLKELTKLEDFLKQGQFDDGTSPEIIQTKITQLKEDISLLDDKLDKYKYSERDYSESIGAYIARLMVEGKLHRKDEQTVKDILSARFNDRGTHGVVNTFKNAAYIDVMGNPMSALTQIGDLAWAMYVGKVWTPKGFSNTINNLINAAFNKSKVTKEDIGIERIAQEFADGTTLGNAVSNVFKIVGLTKIDSIGKETLINNSLNNYQARARSTDQNVVKQLRQELRSIFGNETESLIRELSVDKTGNEKYSDNVKYLLYSRLLDFQPAALSEMPEMYLHAGNGRVFWMLKTYTLKQFDVFRNEVFHKIKNGDANEKLEGIKNMAKITMLLTLANAGADELKDLLLGKEAKFNDHVIENLLTMGGASRFVQMQVTQDGLGSAALQQILPPMKFINSLSKDLIQGYNDYVAGDVMSVLDARTLESLPVLGKLAYWHYGRGTEYKKSIAEQDFKKAGNDARLFNTQLENAKDKRLFLQSNLDRFKRAKIHDNIQSSINNIQETIKKLEKMEQTPNTRKRLGQLESHKEKLFQSYLDNIDQLNLN